MKNFLIYRSSAGSGKTYTLVKEYLKLVLDNPENVRHTLAVTFTNKAADEMKSRIISSLERLAEGKDPGLLKQLKDEGVKCDIETSARYVLNYILHNYSYFSVSTIDSFFQKVIRAFARELKLTIGYNVELDTGEVLDKVVDDIFRDIGDDEYITRYLVDFAYMNIDEDKGWHVDKNIKELAMEIFKERYWEKKLKATSDIADDRRRINELIAGLLESRFIFENKLIKDASESLKIISSNGLTVEDFKYGKSGVAGYLRKLSLKESYSDITNIKPGARPLNILLGKNEWYTGNSPKKSRIEKAVNDGIGRLLEEIISFIEIQFTKYVTIRALLKTVYTVGIFGDIITKLNEYRDLNKTMLISDSNLLLKSVINEDSSPFVYEKIGEYYKNFLIDEFQDTSTFQWQNMLPLLLNSLSEQNFSMVAGDVKQSIYRWRNGNMMLLLRDVEDDLSRFRENIQTEKLAVNRRSMAGVVDFNNRLFKVLPQIVAGNSDEGDSSVISEAYENSAQEVLDKNTGGFIRAEFIPYEKESQKADKRLVEIVKELIDEGINPGDILLLTRKKAELRKASLLLREAGIKFVSDESLLLINSTKVKFIISLFRYIINNNDSYAKAEALYNYSLIENNSGLDINNIFTQTGAAFESIIKPKIENKEIQNRSIYEVTEYILGKFRLNEKADLYLIRFLDVILEYSSLEGREINSFIPWWEENCENYSIIASGQTDSVRLLTIHKAKGLESPVVFLPYANWEINLNGSRDQFWVSSDKKPFNESSAYLVKAAKELKESYFSADYSKEFIMTNLDNLNLLYVALTRAKERLYINSPQKGNNTKCIYTILKTAFESDEWLKGLSISENVYAYGVKEKIKSVTLAQNEVIISSIISSDITNEIITKKDTNDLVEEDGEFTKPDDLKNYEKIIESKKWGNLVHKALSFVKTPDDIKYSLNKVKAECMIFNFDINRLENKLNEIVSHNEISKWFSPANKKIETEVEFITSNDRKDEKFKPKKRIDRIVYNDDETIILDFKSGKEPHGKYAEEFTEHKNQILEYKRIIEQTGYKNVKSFLIYLSEIKVVPI